MPWVLYTLADDNRGKRWEARPEFSYERKEDAERQAKEFRSGSGGTQTNVEWVDEPEQAPPGRVLREGPEQSSGRGGRTKKEQEAIEKKHAEITLKNIEKGTAHASKETIQRLEQQAGRELGKPSQEVVSKEEFEKLKAEERQRRALETAAKIQEKKAEQVADVPFSQKAYARAEEVMALKGEGKLLSEPELKQAIEAEPYRIARIKPETPSEAFRTKEIRVGIPKSKPEDFEVRPASRLREAASLGAGLVQMEVEKSLPEGKSLKTELPFVTRLEGEYDTGIDRRNTGNGIRPMAPVLDISQTGFEKRIERTTKLEEAQERFLKKINYYEGTKRISQTFQNIIPGSGIPSRIIEGGLTGIASSPFFLVGAASQVPVATAKILATGEAIIRPSTRPQVFPELKRAGKETILGLATPETVGFVLAGGIIPTFLKGGGKGKTSDTILKQIQKEQPPTIKGEQYFGYERGKAEVKTTEQIKTPELFIEKPSELITSKYVTDIPKPTVSVAESVGGKTKYNIVGTPEGTQYSTGIRQYKGKDYYLRSITEPAGKTTLKVFRDDTLLKTYKFQSEPLIKFTEPLKQISKKESLSMADFRQDFSTTLSTSKGISMLEKGKYQPIGARVLGERRYLQTITEKPKTQTLAKPVLDLEQGKASFEPKMLKIFETRYKYVSYLPKQKPLIKERTAEGYFVERPTISKTQQITKVSGPFEIGFVKRGKTPAAIKTFEQKTSTIEKALAESVKKSLGQSKLSRPGAMPLKTKGMEIETKKIQKPSGLETMPKEMNLFMPSLEAEIRTLGKIGKGVPVLAIGGERRRAAQQRKERNIFEALPKSEAGAALISSPAQSYYLPMQEPASILQQEGKAASVNKVREYVYGIQRKVVSLTPSASLKTQQPKTDMALKQNIVQTQTQSQKQLQNQLQKQLQTQMTGINRPGSYKTFMPRTIPKIPILPPMPPFTLQPRKKKKGKGVPRMYRYTPSLTAIARGAVTTKKPMKRVYTPFEERPIVVPQEYRKQAMRLLA